MNGAPGRIRTVDQLIKSQLLYRLSYGGIPFMERNIIYPVKTLLQMSFLQKNVRCEKSLKTFSLEAV